MTTERNSLTPLATKYQPLPCVSPVEKEEEKKTLHMGRENEIKETTLWEEEKREVAGAERDHYFVINSELSPMLVLLLSVEDLFF